MLYKYEVKAKGGLTFLKADPYANAAELRPGNASVIADLRTFKWTDSAYMQSRKKKSFKKEPVFIYEMHLGSWKKPAEEASSFTTTGSLRQWWLTMSKRWDIPMWS